MFKTIICLTIQNGLLKFLMYLRHDLGYRVASVDYTYSEKHHDFLKTSGFLYLYMALLSCVYNML